jgi:hypothetical protein
VVGSRLDLHDYLWHLDAGRPTPTMPDVRREDVAVALTRLHTAPIDREPLTRELLDEVWSVASRCGFARLYDAAYVAVALRHTATLVTLDRIVGPAELVQP